MGALEDYLNKSLTPTAEQGAPGAGMLGDKTASGVPTYLASNEELMNPGRSVAMASPQTSAVAPKKVVMSADSPDDDDDDENPNTQMTPQELAGPSPKPGPMQMPAGQDLSQYRVTPEDLQAASDNKRSALMMGAVGDGLANQQSFGNYFLGKMNPHNDVMGDAQKFADLAGDNIKNKQAMMSQGMKENENRAKMAKSYMDQKQAERTQGLQKEMDDPNSTMSKLNASVAMKVAGKIGIPLDPAEFSKMSFTQQQEAINKNPLFKDAMMEDVAGKKLQAVLERERTRGDRGEESRDEKKNRQADQDFMKLAEKINDPSARSKLGAYQANIDKAGALKKMERGLGMPPGKVAPENETDAQRVARYNRANPQDLFEVSKAADALISTQSSTVSGTEHMLPKDMAIDGAKWKEWALGKPMPANAGEFIDKFMHMANREDEFYRGARDAAVEKFTAGYSHLKDRDPERWNKIIGITPQGVQKAGGTQSPQQSYDQDVINYAKSHGITPEQAQAIKIQRTQVAGGK